MQTPSMRPRPSSRRHQASSDAKSTDENWDQPLIINAPSRPREFTFVSETPELYTRSRLSNTAVSGVSSPKHLVGAPHNDMRGKKSLATPVTTSREHKLARDTDERLSGDSMQEVLSLPQMQLSIPSFSGTPINSPSTILPDHLKTSPMSTPALRSIPLKCDDPMTSPVRNGSSPLRSRYSEDAPELQTGDSSFSRSGSKPASESDDHSDHRMQFESYHGSDEQEGKTFDQERTLSSSIRARSHSHPAQNSGSYSVKSEQSSSDSSTSSCFSPNNKPKIGQTRSKAKIQQNVAGRSKNVGTSKPRTKGKNGQRRNGERRREQNAVAQKKFRWKKKQQAAKMEAELEVSTALVSTLKKEAVEKDQLIKILKAEVGNLKRRSKNTECD
ncbi:uncharacterized protein I206_104300 [Kwoniella pini CBS 10737]|uniref:BZIP domain-containing protein n=1 Tax=Kwoniella pini CBS 10737 TaxID=1296096 RepID=A0A1B9I2C6_9TREE|nr:uncharacterized protein I206_04123 [Kwoniella pini CBS 10737]OCF49601.1 hypothetical protein I206_04123 [Kwoniella pini CBS 10737]